MIVNNSWGLSSPRRSEIESYRKPGSKFLDKTGDPPNSSISSMIGSRCAALIGTRTPLKAASLGKSPAVPVAAALHLLPARKQQNSASISGERLHLRPPPPGTDS
ncbi:uncharacterized protein LOC143648517 [Tamandua tetradactyla]|uniref:uncharacterized protein LOC143648517 n=1 Tax=Tamandua tetradactyla TaxID=48850 RepID=UPI004053ECB8